MRIAVGSAVVSALLGATLCGYAQTPPAQPPYPASPRLEANQARPQRDASLQTRDPEAEPRCDKLSGLEKSECERRDVSNDSAPAGVTTSMQDARQDHVTPQSNVDAQTQPSGEEPRCDKLSGLEKSECARRDVSNEAAPAGVTTSMQEKERRRREDAEAAAAASEAEADSDTARRPSHSTPPPMRQSARDPANPDVDADDEGDAAPKDAANRPEQPTESSSDADTLNSPRR
jgi:hypothetical protein